MRVNVYAEEMTDQIEIISKQVDGHTFTGLRLYLHLPVTLPQTVPCAECAGTGWRGGQGGDTCDYCGGKKVQNVQAQGPFMHRPGDDDSSAVTFWGKRDLRTVLRKMLAALDDHYASQPAQHAIIQRDL